MKAYAFERKDDDELFLKGEAISCKVTMTQKDWKKFEIKPMNKLVVMLTNKSKYMARVISVQNVMEGSAVTAEFTVSKDSIPSS